MIHSDYQSVVITDCHCANAALRQSLAWVRHAGTQPPSIVKITGDIDGSGMLVDALVESEFSRAVIFCQASPRDKEAARKRNGSPFGYFQVRETLVICSLDGYMLSLPKQLGLINKDTDIRVMDIPAVLAAIASAQLLSRDDAATIARSQFRSLKFGPRAVSWILDGPSFPTTALDFASIPEIGPCVWWVDNFGNCKTTLCASDVDCAEGEMLQTTIGEFLFVNDLRAVPEDQAAAIVGSSGIEGDEFIEFVVQGANSGSAAKRFGLTVGSRFEISTGRH